MDDDNAKNRARNAEPSGARMGKWGVAVDLDYRKFYSENLKNSAPVTIGLNGVEGGMIVLLSSPSFGAEPIEPGEVGEPTLISRNSPGCYSNYRTTGPMATSVEDIENIDSEEPPPQTCFKTEVPLIPTITSIAGENESLRIALLFSAIEGTNGTSSVEIYLNGGGFTDLFAGSISAEPGQTTQDPYYLAGLENGTTYYVKVRAFNCFGYSEFSEDSAGTPSEEGGPGGNGTTPNKCIIRWLKNEEDEWYYIQVFVPIGYTILDPELERPDCNEPGNPPYYNQRQVIQWYFDVAPIGGGAPRWVYKTTWQSIDYVLTAYDREVYNGIAPTPPDYYNPDWDGL